jgi:hypothetical protein
MNHHDKDFKEGVEKKSATEKPAEGNVIINEDKIDFGSNVDQAVTQIPNPAKNATVEVPEKDLEGKKSKKGETEIRKYENVVGCGFCGISVARGGIGAIVNVPGKKFRKVGGKYTFHSPGADEGKVTAVLCEAHAREADQLPPGVIDIKTAIAINADGARNISVREL